MCLGGESFSICTHFLVRKLTAFCDFETTSFRVLRRLAKCLCKKVVDVCYPT